MSKKIVNDKLDKFMGMPLGGEDSGSESGSDEGSEDHEEEQQKQQPRKKLALSVEDLEKAGYKSGPSVLYVKPPAEHEPQDWNWSNGKAAKDQEEDDDRQDRAATREAVGRGLEESAALAVKSMEHAARLREAARQERDAAKQERLAREKQHLSFNQKEKRKRDTGQASRGKNYVEESKRQAREFGVYSGFD